MKKLVVAVACSGLLLFAGQSLALECTTIQDGTLVNSIGDPIETGFDDWGYNYGAHLFNGLYCESYRNAPWCAEYAEVNIQMKWNEAWLGNKDCDDDLLLDRHFGYATYVGSGAWLTNHQSGKVEVNGKMRQWTYFVKIVAMDDGDTVTDGIVYRGGVEVGPQIWGQFAIVQQVSNDPSFGEHGILYKSPVGPGLGNLN